MSGAEKHRENRRRPRTALFQGGYRCSVEGRRYDPRRHDVSRSHIRPFLCPQYGIEVVDNHPLCEHLLIHALRFDRIAELRAILGYCGVSCTLMSLVS